MIGLLAMAAALNVPQGQDTGNSLLRACQNDNLKAACAGYVSGVYDAQLFSTHVACSPAGVERGQLMDVAVGYLVAHPEVRQENAAFLVETALAAAFPCPK